MRKIAFTALIFMLLGIKLNAQLYDAQWVIGPSTSVLDFRTRDTVKLNTISSTMQIFVTSAVICDIRGDLLYFTNGIYIANSTGDTLTNGTAINPCSYTESWVGSGLDISQAALFLPKPGDSTIYYLIHFSNDTDNGNLPGTLYYTQIKDSGLGYVMQKNIPFGKGIFRQGGITACKHGNGRDYWVVMGLHNTNEYFKYLITPETILGPFIQDIGPVYGGSFDSPTAKFSQDGSKYVTGAIEGYVTVMNFDRCTGEFSNPDSIFNKACDSPSVCSGSVGVEFSPNGRFVYVSDKVNLNQYDLLSDSIQNPTEIYSADSTDLVQIDFPQLAPNGKLYISTWNGGAYFVHVINCPDLKGDSCNFVWGGQTTLSLNSYNLPNMINYNLGPLVGSGCDTILTELNHVTENDLLRVIPNPADKYLYVEMGKQGDYEFDLMNVTGQIVDRKETRQVDNFDTENLASGVYFLKAMDKNSNVEVATKEVVIVH